MQPYPWQHQLWHELTHLNDLPSALLLTGKEGIGKFDIACTFAKTLLCASSGKEPCLSCQSCQLLQSKNHPDFYVIKPKDNSGTINIDQIRVLIEWLTQTPRISSRQVVVIQSAENMNKASANALLKTLEEPSGNVIFLLTASTLQRVPATIKSRCQIHPCFITDDSDGLKWLSKHIPDQPTAKLLWRMSNHAPLLARRLFENDYLNVRDAILKGMQGICKQHQSPIDISKTLLVFDIMAILKNWTVLLVDLWQIKHQIVLDYVINQDKIQVLTSLAHAFNISALERFCAIVVEAMDSQVSQINLNKALLLDKLWIQLTHHMVEAHNN